MIHHGCIGTPRVLRLQKPSKTYNRMLFLALSQPANDPKVRMCGGEDQIEESKYSALKSPVDAHGGRDIYEIIDPFTCYCPEFVNMLQ